jgi:2-(1,2-epoxy-1,2-dihydrophenyl)acetyl-CoA isomerase
MSTPASDGPVQLSVDGAVATVRLHRPEHHNAVTLDMTEGLHEVLAHVSTLDDVHVVVLTGSGRSFCPGADLHTIRSGGDREIRRDRFGASVMLHEMPQVTVAAINGACAGAGLTWAAACDLRVATARANFATAFIDVGVAGDMGGFWTLPRIVGGARARELQFLTGKFDAAHALAIGFVSRVFPDDTFADDVAALVAALASKNAVALRLSKANFVAAERMVFADYIELETAKHLALFSGAAGERTVEMLASRGRELGSHK